MKLRNVLIVVSDIEESINFYRDLFGLQVVLNNDGNVIMTEGLVLQDKNIWKDFLEKDVVPQNNMTELYFEEKNIEDFVEKLNNSRYEIQYVNELMEHSWGQKMVRFYVPGHSNAAARIVRSRCSLDKIL
ncbi:protein containing Glyoxalase/bleomycin resistance protein/dioxygenase domain protein [human gut metagenome]|uniref:Protein containing Glyoxalase/bleomycin resistance protein/dioxygenase domain protein n=1 Tax=human gut metagenome TaxID=408170 RepID=K1TU43_9ZZZZ